MGSHYVYNIDPYVHTVTFSTVYGHRLYYMLLYGYMVQYCKHNGIQLGAHFIYLNFDSILV